MPLTKQPFTIRMRQPFAFRPSRPFTSCTGPRLVRGTLDKLTQRTPHDRMSLRNAALAAATLEIPLRPLVNPTATCPQASQLAGPLVQIIPPSSLHHPSLHYRPTCIGSVPDETVSVNILRGVTRASLRGRVTLTGATHTPTKSNPRFCFLQVTPVPQKSLRD